MTTGQFQVCLIVAAMIVLGVGLHFGSIAMRRRSWIRLARSSGYRYFDEDGLTDERQAASARDVEDVQAFASTTLSGGYHKHVPLERRSGRQAMMCDYVWYHEIKTPGKPGTTKASTSTIVAIRTPSLRLPQFRVQWSMTSDAWSSRTEKVLPEITEHPAAERHGLKVFGSDEAAVSVLLTPTLIDLIRSCDRLVLEGSQDRLILDADRKLNISDAESMLEIGHAIAEHLAD